MAATAVVMVGGGKDGMDYLHDDVMYFVFLLCIYCNLAFRTEVICLL